MAFLTACPPVGRLRSLDNHRSLAFTSGSRGWRLFHDALHPSCYSLPTRIETRAVSLNRGLDGGFAASPSLRRGVRLGLNYTTPAHTRCGISAGCARSYLYTCERAAPAADTAATTRCARRAARSRKSSARVPVIRPLNCAPGARRWKHIRGRPLACAMARDGARPGGRRGAAAPWRFCTEGTLVHDDIIDGAPSGVGSGRSTGLSREGGRLCGDLPLLPGAGTAACLDPGEKLRAAAGRRCELMSDIIWELASNKNSGNFALVRAAVFQHHLRKTARCSRPLRVRLRPVDEPRAAREISGRWDGKRGSSFSCPTTAPITRRRGRARKNRSSRLRRACHAPPSSPRSETTSVSLDRLKATKKPHALKKAGGPPAAFVLAAAKTLVL